MPSDNDWKHAFIDTSRPTSARSVKDWQDLLVMLGGFLSGQKQSNMARALRLDPATVTNRLNQLQEETGCELHRGTRGQSRVDRTKAAINYPLARSMEKRLSRLMEAWQDLDKLFQSEGRTDNQVAVAGTRTAMSKWFPGFLAHTGWLQSNNRAQLYCSHQDSMEDLLNDLELMAYDFVLGPGQHAVPTFVVQESVRLRWGMIYSKNHPHCSDLEKKAVIDLEDFKGYGPVLLRAKPEIDMNPYLPAADEGDCPRIFISSFIQAVGWIRRGLGVAFGTILHVEGSKNLRWKAIRYSSKVKTPPLKATVSLYGHKPPYRASKVADGLYGALLEWLRAVETEDMAHERNP